MRDYVAMRSKLDAQMRKGLLTQADYVSEGFYIDRAKNSAELIAAGGLDPLERFAHSLTSLGVAPFTPSEWFDLPNGYRAQIRSHPGTGFFYDLRNADGVLCEMTWHGTLGGAILAALCVATIDQPGPLTDEERSDRLWNVTEAGDTVGVAF